MRFKKAPESCAPTFRPIRAEGSVGDEGLSLSVAVVAAVAAAAGAGVGAGDGVSFAPKANDGMPTGVFGRITSAPSGVALPAFAAFPEDERLISSGFKAIGVFRLGMTLEDDSRRGDTVLFPPPPPPPPPGGGEGDKDGPILGTLPFSFGGVSTVSGTSLPSLSLPLELSLLLELSSLLRLDSSLSLTLSSFPLLSVLARLKLAAPLDRSCSCFEPADAP